ncbi:hypothetical protein BFJ72_g5457 [Fusarium proliferatum]|uniref:Uncharacterized protein n=1 Tax=Gibberella intermedia TaxID=948311 RepID=A0A420TJ42_GIBIN|nr:hypothetical protein BFJ72_g5457 [Fusarium proliferatum]
MWSDLSAGVCLAPAMGPPRLVDEMRPYSAMDRPPTR